MTKLCRFAPSPTGFLHVGNIRAAIINYLYSKKVGAKFILRLDDTDSSRVKEEYKDQILKDLKWLSLDYDQIVMQSERLEKYEQAKNKLIESGRLYACYESQQELQIQRKSQTSSGLPPVYDRAALNLTVKQRENLESEGRKPYFRFLLKDEKVSWQDKIKGNIEYSGLHFSDPVLVRDNSVPTYTFCSVVDDIEFGVSDIIRGEDHITNTAIQIQIFKALKDVGYEFDMPEFSHLALVKALDGKISKRIGGFDVKNMREIGIEPLSLILLLSQIGTSKSVEIYRNIDKLIEDFNFGNFSKSSTKYDIDEVKNINQKLIQTFDFSYIRGRLQELNLGDLSEEFFNIFKENIELLPEIEKWWKLCNLEFRFENSQDDKEFLKNIAKILPQDTSDKNCWQIWLQKIKESSQRKGKDLFMPIRLALTGEKHGPEIKNLVNFIGREEIIARLNN